MKELIKLMGESKIDLTSDEVIIIGGVLEMRGKIIITLHFNRLSRKNSQKYS